MFLYAFDLLELDGVDYRELPLEKRKAKLKTLLARTKGMHFVEHVEGDGSIVFEQQDSERFFCRTGCALHFGQSPGVP